MLLLISYVPSKTPPLISLSLQIVLSWRKIFKDIGLDVLKFQWWHGVDGGLFEGVDGAGVFLGVGEAAVSEDAGYGFDIGAVAQQVCSATVTGSVPSDMFLDAGASHPVAQGFQAHDMQR